MEKANDQQAKIITSQKNRLEAQNLCVFIFKSGSNRSEKLTMKNSEMFTFPLSSIRHAGAPQGDSRRGSKQNAPRVQLELSGLFLWGVSSTRMNVSGCFIFSHLTKLVS
jgi:hypothetical protein